MLRTTIVIPTHNRSAMVREAIDSALPFCAGGEREVVVVNDGSTDDTAAVLASYGDRIRVVHVKHGERAQARNTGVEMARGQYVVFLDDDDQFLPGGIPLLEKAAAAAPAEAAVIYGRPRYVKVDPENPLKASLPETAGATGWIYPVLLGINFMQPGAVMVRADAFKQSGGFASEWVPIEDWDLWLRLAARWQVIYVDAEIAEVRLHGGNSIRNIQHAGRVTDRVREHHVLSAECLEYALRHERLGDGTIRKSLAERCMDLACRRWWEGELDIVRRAFYQACRLDRATAFAKLPVIWRAWIPIHRSRALRPGPSSPA